MYIYVAGPGSPGPADAAPREPGVDGLQRGGTTSSNIMIYIYIYTYIYIYISIYLSIYLSLSLSLYIYIYIHIIHCYIIDNCNAVYNYTVILYNIL